MKRWHRIAGTGLLALIGVAACTSRDPSGPPRVHYGEDLCRYCNMIVSDERFVAAEVVEVAPGRYDDLVFDDLGCLLHYRGDHPDDTVAATWVRDFGGEAGWLPAAQASYLRSSSLQTPMLSGLAAMSSPKEVRNALSRYPGELLEFDELAGTIGENDADDRVSME